MKNEIINEIESDPEEYKEVYQQIAEAFVKLDKNDDEFINVGLKVRSLDDFDLLTNNIKEYMNEAWKNGK